MTTANLSIEELKKRACETIDKRKKEITDFYREEFLRHRSRLENQRPFFAEQTYEEIESVLFNRVVFGLLVLLTVYTTYQDVRDGRKSKD